MAAESSTSNGFSGMPGGCGQYCCYQNVEMHDMITLGTKHLQVCSSFHPKIRSLKSTKVGSKLLGRGGGQRWWKHV